MIDKNTYSALRTRLEHEYADYLTILHEESKPRDACDMDISAPHCDAYVLHSPGICQYCDAFPVLQRFRTEHRIAFTGETPQDNERPCPATLFRPTETIHRWQGNRPYHRSEN